MMTAVLLVVGGVYVAFGVLLYAAQPRFVYFPEIGREITVTPRAVGLEFEDIRLDVEPGVRLHGWYVPSVQARGTVLLLHGNAGSIALRMDWLTMFHRLGYATFIIDYRGYGASTGTPSEAGTYRDAEAAWAYLVERRGVTARDTVIVGESLGGAVAAWLAARVAPRALVLQSAFTSVPDLAAQIYPMYPVRWMSRFGYETRRHVQSIDAPILIAHSRTDEIIPFSHGQRLFEAAREPRRLIEMHGGHNDAFLFSRPEWTDALAQFLSEARGRSRLAAGNPEQPGDQLADRHR